MNASAIITKDLTKKFGDVIAVDNLNLNIPRGKIFGILGPNGCGKSTTLRMLCGVISPSSGSGEVLGYDIVKDSELIKQNTGYMSQKFSLYQDLTVEENMKFYAGIYSLSAGEMRERMKWLKDMTNLHGKERFLVASLSGGWKQRVALCCALIHKPKLLILDEPTAGVDPVSRRVFWKAIHRLAEDGITVLVTTHYMDEAETCHNIAFLFSGRLLTYGPPGELMRNYKVDTLEEVFLSLVQRETGETVEMSFRSYIS